MGAGGVNMFFYLSYHILDLVFKLVLTFVFLYLEFLFYLECENMEFIKYFWRRILKCEERRKCSVNKFYWFHFIETLQRKIPEKMSGKYFSQLFVEWNLTNANHEMSFKFPTRFHVVSSNSKNSTLRIRFYKKYFQVNKNKND